MPLAPPAFLAGEPISAPVIVATFVLAGPRALEVAYLLWRDVDLANGRLFVGRSKTQAGLREIKMLPILRDLLAAHNAEAHRSGPDNLVFPTATGGRRDKDNLRDRVLAPIFERANEILEKRGPSQAAPYLRLGCRCRRASPRY